MFLPLLIVFGCQEPFGADRHDLLGFRIAAVTAEVEAGQVRPTAALIVDGRLWSAAPVTLDWAFIDAPGDAELEPSPVASGPAVELTRTSDRLALHAYTADQSAWAELDLTERTRFTPTIHTAIVDRDISTLTVEDLTRDARRAWETRPGSELQPNGVLRVTLDGAPPTARGRFMATGGGTYLELEANQADWMAAEVLIDDEEITVEPIEAGAYSVLVAAIDDHSSGFAVHDLHVGTEVPGVWTRGRHLPSTQALAGAVWARLVVDDAATAGIGLEDLVAAEPGDTWDPESVGCVGVAGPFDPSWLLTGACTRDALVGARVLLELDP